MRGGGFINWGAALVAVMSAMADDRRYQSRHANGPTPRRQRFRAGRAPHELHRLRKAKRLQPVAPRRVS